MYVCFVYFSEILIFYDYALLCNTQSEEDKSCVLSKDHLLDLPSLNKGTCRYLAHNIPNCTMLVQFSEKVCYIWESLLTQHDADISD